MSGCFWVIDSTALVSKASIEPDEFFSVHSIEEHTPEGIKITMTPVGESFMREWHDEERKIK